LRGIDPMRFVVAEAEAPEGAGFLFGSVGSIPQRKQASKELAQIL